MKARVVFSPNGGEILTWEEPTIKAAFNAAGGTTPSNQVYLRYNDVVNMVERIEKGELSPAEALIQLDYDKPEGY